MVGPDRPRRLLAVLAICALCGMGVGCAPIWSPINAQTPRPFYLSTIEVKAVLPVGWMSSTYGPLGGVWLFTRHGQELEEIYLRRWPKTQVVKGTNRNIRGDMTIQDVSKLSLDSRRLDDGVGALRVLSNKPTEVGGRDCYRLDYTYRNAIGLGKRTVEYGCLVGPWIYRFEFNAPNQYYFERGIEAFEQMTRTIQFTAAGV
jgi:hypothetical protein